MPVPGLPWYDSITIEEDIMVRPVPISTDRFTWVRDTRTFVTEMSDLPRGTLGQVYHDACDVGLILESARTGRSVTFAELRELVTGKGTDDEEVVGWEFSPVRGTPAHLSNLRVIVYND